MEIYLLVTEERIAIHSLRQLQPVGNWSSRRGCKKNKNHRHNSSSSGSNSCSNSFSCTYLKVLSLPSGDFISRNEGDLILSLSLDSESTRPAQSVT